MVSSSHTEIANIGRWSSNVAGTLTIIFALSTIFDYESNRGIDFLSCFLLPIAYVIVTLANSHVIKASSEYSGITTVSLSQFYADAAVLFAIPYCCYICMVYYLQLTFVRMVKNPDDPVINSIVRYWPGTANFAVDILGYSFLGLSTVFLGLSLVGRHNHTTKFLQKLLYFHGFVGFVGFFTPFLPFIYEDVDTDNEGDDSLIWQMPLFTWCLVFAPICFLMARYFRLSVVVPAKKE